MRFVPYANNKWYRLKPLSRPDEAEQDYLRQTGEFSIYREESFNKHLNELSKWNKFFSGYNGKKIKMILQHEPLRYGKAKLSKLLYK